MINAHFETNTNENRSQRNSINLICPEIIPNKKSILNLKKNLYTTFINKSKTNKNSLIIEKRLNINKPNIREIEINDIFNEQNLITNRKIMNTNYDIFNSNISTVQSSNSSNTKNLKNYKRKRNNSVYIKKKPKDNFSISKYSSFSLNKSNIEEIIIPLRKQKNIFDIKYQIINKKVEKNNKKEYKESFILVNEFVNILYNIIWNNLKDNILIMKKIFLKKMARLGQGKNKILFEVSRQEFLLLKKLKTIGINNKKELSKLINEIKYDLKLI